MTIAWDTAWLCHGATSLIDDDGFFHAGEDFGGKFDD